jgi:hypothetical protein
LIDEVDFGEYNILYLIEDTMISSRIDKPSLLYLFSEDGFPEPYDEYFFNGCVSWFDMDEEHDRIFVRKFGSYESFTYDYVVDVKEQPQLENGIQLSNFPNPFSTSTTISFNLPTDSRLNWGHKNAEIKIYNVKGQLIKEFKMQKVKGKNIEVVWDGKDENGNQVPNGIYLYKLSNGENEIVRKMILLR